MTTLSEIFTSGGAGVEAGSFKNKIINGDFDLWQRGTSASPSVHTDFLADRYTTDFSTAGVVNIARSAQYPTQVQSGHQSKRSFFLQATTADASVDAADYYIIQQKLEGYTYSGLAGKTCTLSFWVKSIKTGIFCVAFRNGGADRSYIAEYTVNTTDTWEKKTITLTFDQSGGTEQYEAGIGLYMAFVIMCGANLGGQTANNWISGNKLATTNQVNGLDSTDNTMRFSQVQLEVGTSATSFESRSFAEELALCQRYFEKSYDTDINPATAIFEGMVISYSTGNTSADHIINIPVRFAVTKRETPTIAVYTYAGTIAKVDMASGEVTGSGNEAGMTGFYLVGTNGAASVIRKLYAHFTADAEL